MGGVGIAVTESGRPQRVLFTHGEFNEPVAFSQRLL